MPIHLTPISRRQFIVRTLALGAGLALAPHLSAKSRPRVRVNPDAWALLSDTHIAADVQNVQRNTNMADHLRAVSQQLLALPERPAGVFVTGDCALNSGESADYQTFASLLEPLRLNRIPIHIGLGNHDHRERFWAAVKDAKPTKQFRNRQVCLVKTSKVHWYVLDSLETTLSTPGLLGEDQLTWLAKSLDANPRTPAIILIHHNPAVEANSGALKDTDAFYQIIRPRRQVKAYFFGHTHRWSVSEDPSGIHLVNLPPVAYIFREGDPAGWVNATLREDGIILELRCLDENHAAHQQRHVLRWRV